jgi:hypothetical protein
MFETITVYEKGVNRKFEIYFPHPINNENIPRGGGTVGGLEAVQGQDGNGEGRNRRTMREESDVMLQTWPSLLKNEDPGRFQVGNRSGRNRKDPQLLLRVLC